ncbi:hypothetical protein M413DRAFT_258277 [Hebeloma cylindrosporum]|uniref:Uncharacterized protein n=1 Tax=Hebeloma cylindrosporum TaxID=76867 RepID=A0A0C3C1Y4_HEBCY|nr:hypothetical protein M413DRAFT_258277 [Hebeloma cylindrosporum h7]
MKFSSQPARSPSTTPCRRRWAKKFVYMHLKYCGNTIIGAGSKPESAAIGGANPGKSTQDPTGSTDADDHHWKGPSRAPRPMTKNTSKSGQFVQCS